MFPTVLVEVEKMPNFRKKPVVIEATYEPAEEIKSEDFVVMLNGEPKDHLSKEAAEQHAATLNAINRGDV